MNTNKTIAIGEANNTRVNLVLNTSIVFKMEYEVRNSADVAIALPDLQSGMGRPFTYSSGFTRRSSVRVEPGMWTFPFEIRPGSIAGAWKVNVFIEPFENAPLQTIVLDFAVSASTPLEAATARPDKGLYCNVADLRGEGLTEEMANDAKALELCKRAAAYVEQYTGRFFEPRHQALYMDGNATRTLHMPHPIIEVTEIAILNRHFAKLQSGDFFVVSRENYVIGNRWISGRDDFGRIVIPADGRSGNVLNQDDREFPTIAFVVPDEVIRRYGGRRPWAMFGTGNSGQGWGPHGVLFFPAGRQNVRVVGTFGYVDQDPDTGAFIVPPLVKRAAIMLALKNRHNLIDSQSCQDAADRSRLVSESTDGHSYSLTTPWLRGEMTGDWEIDSVLARYRRQASMATA